MRSLEEINMEIEHLKKRLEELEKKKEEAMIRQGRAYRCRKCGKLVEIIPGHHKEYYDKQLCYVCWALEQIEKMRGKWLEFLQDIRVVDVDIDDYPYDSDTLLKIVFVKNGKKYALEAYCYEDDYGMRIIDLETNERVVVKP